MDNATEPGGGRRISLTTILGTPEQIDARISRQIAGRNRMRAEAATIDGFCPFDLGHWMDLAVRAGVPIIPAVAVARGPTSAWNEDRPYPTLSAMIAKANAAVQSASGPRMLRWSWASHGNVKGLINAGERDWHPDLVELYVEDERTYDLQLVYPLPEFAIWMRPWVNLMSVRSPLPTNDPTRAAEDRRFWNEIRAQQGRPLIHGPLPTYDVFALEARVFVENGRVKGVSAYFPKCPLDPVDPNVRTLFAKAREYAGKLVSSQTKPLIIPDCPPLHGKAINTWTADFVMSASGEVGLLEGGPPHAPWSGANSCCFEGHEIEGDAFAPIGIDENRGSYAGPTALALETAPEGDIEIFEEIE